jgi:hypothetical protein
MKNLKLDFTIDYITGEKIPILEYRDKFKLIIVRKKNNYYISEIANFYYKEKYSLNIIQVLSSFYKIPICPVTGEFVSFKLGGSIVFGQFSSNCPSNKKSKHVAENNEKYKSFVERMKVDRVGSGNPMYNKKAWNSGLNLETSEVVKKYSEKRVKTLLEYSPDKKEEVSKNLSKARKHVLEKPGPHGHTGFKHSEESKQIMREKTIARFKGGKFPQTNSLPHKLVRELCETIFGKLGEKFYEEFSYGGFIFDFRIDNYLIEVQGDYFHCNPNTRHAIPKNDMQKNNLERDKRKHSFVKELGKYILIELWEYDIINNIEKIKKCLINLKK